MKKLFGLSLLAMTLFAACKPSVVATDATDVEGLSTIDVEKLIEPFDLDMGLSQLSISDLYILRHAFAARKGFPFRDAYLRGIYGTTTWYDSLTWVFDEDSLNFKHLEYKEGTDWRDYYYDDIRELTYTDEEQAFMQRAKEREDELRKLNFEVGDGYRVNVRNLLNARQVDSIDSGMAERLAQNGFAIVPAQHQQLFHVYEQNDYHLFPSFVTTDLYLQLYHLYFDATLREVEEKQLHHLLVRFCNEALKAFPARQYESVGQDTPDATTWLNTYFTVALALLTEQPPMHNAVAQAEYIQVMKSENNLSEFLGYTEVPFEYSLFRPRGHYTRNDTLKRYFRTMMWLQTVPFQTDRPSDMFKASLLANEVYYNKELNALYTSLTEPMTWLMGQPDDVSILQVGELLAKMGTDDIAPHELGKKIDEIAERQTRLRPKFQHTGRNKVRLMPQRYQPDAEVLQEMVDYAGDPTTRAVPQGLDVMAAMGIASAEQILKEEQQKWKGFQAALSRMKARMDSIDWQETIAKQWLQVLKTNTQVPQKAPYYMVTPQWQRKSLNASLASWAELKHDAILYAKQPMGAECGGAGPPDPVLKGYVEPNTGFWMKATELIANTENTLRKYGLLTDRAKMVSERMGEMATFLLNVSQKELDGTPLSDEENDQLQHIGATFENISLELLREPDQYLYEWADVQGPERSVALIADVYTANADNNPSKCILYAGTGQADEIYVVVEMQGYLYLTRGAVFSYRELKRPIGEQRMNDDEWQQRLENDPRQGIPQWMQPITVPVEQAPVDNEEVFYSSGC